MWNWFDRSTIIFFYNILQETDEKCIYSSLFLSCSVLLPIWKLEPTLQVATHKLQRKNRWFMIFVLFDLWHHGELCFAGKRRTKVIQLHSLGESGSWLLCMCNFYYYFMAKKSETFLVCITGIAIVDAKCNFCRNCLKNTCSLWLGFFISLRFKEEN